MIILVLAWSMSRSAANCTRQRFDRQFEKPSPPPRCPRPFLYWRRSRLQRAAAGALWAFCYPGAAAMLGVRVVRVSRAAATTLFFMHQSRVPGRRGMGDHCSPYRYHRDVIAFGRLRPHRACPHLAALRRSGGCCSATVWDHTDQSGAPGGWACCWQRL